MSDAQEEEEEDEAAELKRLQNSCELVWEGVILRPTFYNFRTEECYSASMARKFLTSHGVAHYCKRMPHMPPLRAYWLMQRCSSWHLTDG